MRAGLFLCECGGNISGVLDLERLADHGRSRDGVVAVAKAQFLCGTEARTAIARTVAARGLDHLVIGACSPRFQGPTFERIARELGLGEGAVTIANLREGCSFVHAGQPDLANEKAGRIVDGAVARAGQRRELSRSRVFLHRSVLVVGGGIAGLTAAEELTAAGVEVQLVEREASLGGTMARLSKTFPTEDCAMCSLAPRLSGVAMDPRVHVHALTEVVSIAGPPGEFCVRLRHRPRFVRETCVACGRCEQACPAKVPNPFDSGVSQRKAIYRPFANAVPGTFAIDEDACRRCGACAKVCPSGAIDLDDVARDEEIAVGAILVATGHREFDAHRKIPLGYGRFVNVLTQAQVARLLAAGGPTAGRLVRPSDGAAPRSVLMLQCVGSRDLTSSGNAHCSAICCLFATLHASLIVQHAPGTAVTIAYTDLRAPGKAHEEYYRLVQTRGVRTVRGRVGEIVEEPDRSLKVRLEDTVTGRKSEESYDLVVLSAGLEASEGTAQIARVAGLQTGAAGFVKEVHPKLRPVDTPRAGIFVCGTAQGPKSIPDSIAQAKAASARIVSMLSSGFVLTSGQVAASDPATCVGCGVCVAVCPQAAVALDPTARGAAQAAAGSGDRAVAQSSVDPCICRGCGICAAECPTGAMQVGGFSDAEILAEVTA